MNEKVWIVITISLKFVCVGPINYNEPTLVQVMPWSRIGDKPIPEPILT